MSHPDDEMLSALLDGEAPPGEAAHADGCTECQGRLAELRQASTLVATRVVLPPAHLREAAVASALRAVDGPVRAGGAPRRMRALSAAAVLVVALAVGGLLISQVGRGGTTADTNTALNSAGSSSGGAEKSDTGTADAAASMAAPAAGMSSQASGGTAGPYEAGELGAISDIDQVIQRASTDLAQPSSAPTPRSQPAPSPCPVETDAGATLWQATLRFRGEPAVAHAVQNETGRVMRILRLADCSLLASRGF